MIGLALVPAATPGQGSPPAPQTTLAIEHVTLVPLDQDRLVPDQTVVVAGGRISYVGPAGAARSPPGARRIDGRGRFLMAGLADMHAHTTAADFRLFLANGITTVREMNGSPSHLAWRDSVARRLRLGPTLVVAGPLIAGVRQRWRHVVAGDSAQADSLVRDQAAAGYDFVKVYDGLSPEAYRGLITAARELGIPTTGHIPEAVGLDWVLAHGQATIEHAEQILHVLEGHPPDSAAIAGAVQRIAAAGGTWVTPTLAVLEGLALIRSAGVQRRFDRPEMAYVDSSTMAWWHTLRRTEAGAPTAQNLRYAEALRQVVRLLHARGVPLLVGTDTPNPLAVPGFSLHDELDALDSAGIGRFEVLRAATRGAAAFLGQSGEFGAIAPGLRADLLLLETNPLDDLGVLRRPLGVVVRGTWLSREDLAALLR